MKLDGSIAIVTGASHNKGIGTAICRKLAKEGADIFFTHWGSNDELDDGNHHHRADCHCLDFVACGLHRHYEHHVCNCH